MLQLFQALIGTTTFGQSNRTFVQIVNSKDRSKICSGYITSVNFKRDEIKVVLTDMHTFTADTFRISEIQTISRMKDGRLRMWIEREVRK